MFKQQVLVPIISTKAFNFQLRGRCNGHGLGGKALRSAEGILQRIAAVEVLILHLPNTHAAPKAAVRVQTVRRKVEYEKDDIRMTCYI